MDDDDKKTDVEDDSDGTAPSEESKDEEVA